jgi:hypothetical protein
MLDAFFAAYPTSCTPPRRPNECSSRLDPLRRRAGHHAAALDEA